MSGNASNDAGRGNSRGRGPRRLTGFVALLLAGIVIGVLFMTVVVGLLLSVLRVPPGF